ncbi:MAG: CHAT domain-containing protein [Candidatus Hodarchaeota archaeon]
MTIAARIPVTLKLWDNAFHESSSEGKRMVIWVRSERREGFQYWERISASAYIGYPLGVDIFASAVARIFVRESLQQTTVAYNEEWEAHQSSTSFTLPTGRVGVLVGAERRDSFLVWSEGRPPALCETDIQARWPDCERIQRLGADLWLVAGVTVPFAAEELTDNIPTSLERTLKLARNGRYGEALARARQDVWLAQTCLTDDDLLLAKCIRTLACVHHYMDDYASAELLFMEAKEILERDPDESHPDFATALSDIAKIKLQKGELSAAEDLLQQALQIRRHALGEDNEAVVDNLRELARIQEAKRDYATAGSNFIKAMDISRKLLGEIHPLSVAGLEDIARLLHTIGQHKDAADIYDSLTKIYARVGYFYGTRRFASTNKGFMTDMLGGGFANTAVKFVDEAMQKSEVQAFGEGDFYDEQRFYQDLVNFWMNYGCVSAAVGNSKKAFSQMTRAIEINQDRIQRVLFAGSERQRSAFSYRIRKDLDIFLSLVTKSFPDSATEVQAAFEAVAKLKGIEAEVIAVQQEAVLHGQHSDMKYELKHLIDVRRQIAQELANGPGQQALNEYYCKLKDWSAEREVLEAQLGERIVEAKFDLRLMDVNYKKIASALPQGTSLVEFVRFNFFDFSAVAHANNDGSWNSPQYCKSANYLAFVVSGDQLNNVKMLDLGDAERIDRMLAEFRESITRQQYKREHSGSANDNKGHDVNDACHIGTKLREAIFDPVEQLLRDGDRVMIAPDGDLWRLPFEVLPVPNGELVIDKREVIYVRTGRDIIQFGVKSKHKPGQSIVIADPNFDLVAENKGTASSRDNSMTDKTVSMGETPLSDKRERFHPGDFEERFLRLPGTREEGECVADMLGVECWVGDEALKRRLRNAPPPRILHLATHGFFVPQRQVHIDTEGQWPSAQTPMNNPLLRSGIALAGANTFFDEGQLPLDAENGLLMAEDVACMDLTGTELVVLSACETGLGDVRIGEGVFGLRRAFVVAGARTLVISLWKVPDEETRELMEEFYQRILAGESGSAALHQARLAMKMKYGDVFLWGAFVYQGDPSPLRSITTIQDLKESAVGAYHTTNCEKISSDQSNSRPAASQVESPCAEREFSKSHTEFLVEQLKNCSKKGLDVTDILSIQEQGWTIDKIDTLIHCVIKWMRILKTDLQIEIADQSPFHLGQKKRSDTMSCQDGILYLNRVRSEYLTCIDVFAAHMIGHRIELTAGRFRDTNEMCLVRNKRRHPGIIDNYDRILLPPFGIPCFHDKDVERILPSIDEEIGSSFREIGCDSVAFQKQHASMLSFRELLQQYLVYLNLEAERLFEQIQFLPGEGNDACQCAPIIIPAVARIAAGASFVSLFASEILHDEELVGQAETLNSSKVAGSTPNEIVDQNSTGCCKTANLIRQLSQSYQPAFSFLVEAYRSHFVSSLGLGALFAKERMEPHLDRFDSLKTDNKTFLNEIRLISIMQDPRFAGALIPYAINADEEDDEVVNIQIAAIEALGRICNRESIMMLIGNIESDDLNTAHYSRNAIEDFLRRSQRVSFLPDVLAKITDLVVHGSEDAQWRALECLTTMVKTNSSPESLWEAVNISLGQLGYLDSKICTFCYKLYYEALTVWPQRKCLLEHLTIATEHIQGDNNQLKVDAFFAWCAAAKNNLHNPSVLKLLPQILALVEDKGFNEGLGYGQRTANRHFCSGMADVLKKNCENRNLLTGLLKIVERSKAGDGIDRNLWIELWEKIAEVEGADSTFLEHLPSIVTAFTDKDYNTRQASIFAWGYAMKAHPGSSQILSHLPQIISLIEKAEFKMQQPALCAYENALAVNPGNEKVLAPLQVVVKYFKDPSLGSWALSVWGAAASVNPGNSNVLNYLPKVVECFDLWGDNYNDVQAGAFKAWGIAAKTNPGNKQVLRYLPDLGRHLPESKGKWLEEPLNAWADALEANPENENILSYTPLIARHLWYANTSQAVYALHPWVRAATVAPTHPEILRSKEVAYITFSGLYEDLQVRWQQSSLERKCNFIDHWSMAAVVFHDVGSPLKELPFFLSRVEDSDAEVRACVIDAWRRLLLTRSASEDLLKHLPEIATRLGDPDDRVVRTALRAWEAAAQVNDDHPMVEATRKAYQEASSR